jgi:cell division protein FtsQ
VKRPEGFDRGAPDPGNGRPGRPDPARRGPANRKSAAKPPVGRQPPTPRERAEPAARPTQPQAPLQPQRPGPSPHPSPAARQSSKPTGAARPRTARAEFAAADRARKREERAEVRRFTRRSRRRRLDWLAAAGVVLVLVLFVVAAVFSPLLALKQITVDGTSRLDPTLIEKAVDSQKGTPLALLDETRLREDLAQFTLIRSYSTEVVPPGTLLIHIIERAPIGIIQAADGFRLVDPAGVVIDTLPQRPTGVPLIQLEGGDDVSSAGFASMAQVLLALPSSVLAQVETISARTRDDVTLTLAVSGQRVVWGSAERSEEKAQDLAALLAQHATDGPGEYNVSAPDVAIWHADA